MAFVTPKTNWAPTDGVSDVDLNRIEGNTLFNNDKIPAATTFVSSFIGGVVDYTLIDDGRISICRVFFNIPANSKLVLQRLQYDLSDVGVDLGLFLNDIPPGLIVTFSGQRDDINPGTILETNATGSPITATIFFTFTNLSGAAIGLKADSGFVAQIEIEPI